MHMMEPQVQWLTASPLWSEAATATDPEGRLAFRQPAILRFASDSFMNEFLALLDNEPGRLGDLRIQPETWREPAPLPKPVEPIPNFARNLQRLRLAAGATRPSAVASAAIAPTTTTGSALLSSATENLPLKLYQAAHQRFYLVIACLVCQVPGLPDRMLDTSQAERATFVIRRLLPRDNTIPANQLPPPTLEPGIYDEYAFVTIPGGNAWQKVTNSAVPSADIPVAGEEQIPLFGVYFNDLDVRRRRLLGGLIPVGKREKYLGTGQLSTAESGTPIPPDIRKTLLLLQVLEPWSNLIALEQAGTFQPAPNISVAGQIKLASWYILLDFAEYLAKYLPDVWQVVEGKQPESSLTGAEIPLFNTLKNTSYTDVGGNSISLSAVLARIEALRTQLETVSDPYTEGSTAWPSFNFPLTDPSLAALVQVPTGGTGLQQLIEAALPGQPPNLTLPTPPLAQDGQNTGGPGWFIIRCVFERPNCGPLKAPVVSNATVPFQLASYFDPDAPARPVRISLPVDTSIAGLRKFTKSVTFLISDKLQQQMNCISDVKKVLDGSLSCNEPVPDAGQICTFSIPIITICALIVLLIFVILLNIVFFWLPFLKICFPLPGLKSKE